MDAGLYYTVTSVIFRCVNLKRQVHVEVHHEQHMEGMEALLYERCASICDFRMDKSLSLNRGSFWLLKNMRTCHFLAIACRLLPMCAQVAAIATFPRHLPISWHADNAVNTRQVVSTIA
jgi:hypothetical protein